jgi:hypothetical protein
LLTAPGGTAVASASGRMNATTLRIRSSLFAIALLLGAGAVTPAVSRAGEASPGHAGISCQDCHALVTAGMNRAVEASERATKCRDCHIRSLSDESLSRGFHAVPGRSCLDCHSFHDSAVLSAGDRRFRFDYASEAVAEHCRSCHEGGGGVAELSPGHLAATAFYHSDTALLAALSPSEGCLQCHSNGPLGSPVSDLPLDPPRFNEHASHPYSVPVVQGDVAGIVDDGGIRLRLFSGRMECQTCHHLTNLADDYLVPFPSKYDLCRSCHRDR